MYITIAVLPLDLNKEIQQRFQEIQTGIDNMLSKRQNSMQDDEDIKAEFCASRSRNVLIVNVLNDGRLRFGVDNAIL